MDQILRIRGLAAARGIPVVVDLLPVFRPDPRCLYMNDTHWNPEGQALAAEALASALLPLTPPARTLAETR